MTEVLWFSELENKNKKECEKIFKTKEDLVIFEIKNNCSRNVIKRKLKELKQSEKELEELKQQEKELWMCLEEDGEIQTKVNEIVDWIKENTIKHTVKKWDTLRSICKKHYKHGAYSQILTDELWYKTLIIPWEILHLPSEKWMKKLKIGGLQKKQENQEIQDNQDKNVPQKDKWLSDDFWWWENNHTEPQNNNQSPKSPQNPQISIEEQANQDFQEEANQNKETSDFDVDKFEQEKTILRKEYLLIYAQYLENYANNMNFASFRDDYKNLKDLSKYIKENIDNINLWNLKTEFNQKLWVHHNITEWFKKLIIALWNEDITNIWEYEINIIQSLRSADKNDDLINWNYEMPIQNKALKLTEKEIKEENPKLKEIIKQLDMLKNSDPKEFITLYESLETKYVWNGHRRRKVKDFSKLNDLINTSLDNYKPELVNQRIKEFFRNYEKLKKEIYKQAQDQAEKLLKEKKAWYYQDNMWIERPNPNYDSMKKELTEKIYNYVLNESIQKIWEDFVEQIKQKLIDDYIENKDQDKITPIQDLYSEINWLKWYTSDKNEEKYKYWTKEVLIQTAMLIPAIRVADRTTFLLVKWTQKIEEKFWEQIIGNYAWRKATEYVVNWSIFTQNYNLADTARVYKDDLVDKEQNKITWEDIFMEKAKDVEALTKNILMLWWLRFLHEHKLIVKTWENNKFKIERITKEWMEKWEKWMIYGFEEKIGQNIENKYTSYVVKKIWWIWLETWVVYSLWSLWNVMFWEDILTEEDAIFGFAMVASLRLVWKPVKALEDKVVKITKPMIEEFKKINLDKLFNPKEWKIDNKNMLVELLSNPKIIIEIFQEFSKRFKNPEEALNKKDQRNVDNYLIKKIHKIFEIKQNDKLIETDKRRIKYILNKLKSKLKDLARKSKWEEWQGGNTINHGYMPNARFGEVIKIEQEQVKNSKLVWDIIKSLNKKWYKLTDGKVKDYVEGLIKKLVDKKFEQAKNEWKKVYEQDKKILEKRLYWEYMELSKTIEEIKNSFKWKKERISKLIEKLNPVEYKEIISELNKFVKEKWDSKWWKENKEQFNN